MDIMSIGIPITANDAPALAAFRNLETAGRQTASTVTATMAQATAALNALGIAARTASVNGIDRIVVSGAQLEQTNEILTRMGGGLQAVEVQTKKVAAGATVSATSYTRWGNAAIRGAGAMMLMGDALSGSDKSMQTVLRTGSSIAFMFGPTGAVVGAVGIMASMVVGAFNRSKEAIQGAKDEAKKFADEIRDIRFAIDIGGLMGKAGVNDAALRAKQAEVDEAQRKVAAAIRAETAAATDAQFAARRKATIAAEQELATRQKALATLEQERVAINETVASLSQSEQASRDATAAIEAREDAREEAIRGIESEAGWLRQLRELGGFRATDLNRARTLEIQYAAEIRAGNLSLEDRIILLDKLSSVQAAAAFSLAETIEGRFGGDVRRGESTAGLGKGAAAIVEENQRRLAEQLAKQMAQVFPVEGAVNLGAAFGVAFSHGVGQGIADGFATVFAGGSLFEGIEAMGRGFLSTFGQIIKSIGEQALAANLLAMTALGSLGTTAGIAAAIGLIGLGAALIGLGGAGRGGGRSIGAGSGRGGGYVRSGTEDTATRYSYNSRTGSMTGVEPRGSNAYFLMGSNPQLERFIAKVAKKGGRRGLGGRGIVRINGERV